MLNVAHHGWAAKRPLHFKLPKVALNSFLLPFYLTEKHDIYILDQKTFIKQSS